MIRNFFKIAWRNLLRNKGFSFINIFGLAVGMASTILILLWIQNEISHERFHKPIYQGSDCESCEIVTDGIKTKHELCALSS